MSHAAIPHKRDLLGTKAFINMKNLDIRTFLYLCVMKFSKRKVGSQNQKFHVYYFLSFMVQEDYFNNTPARKHTNIIIFNATFREHQFLYKRKVVHLLRVTLQPKTSKCQFPKAKFAIGPNCFTEWGLSRPKIPKHLSIAHA